jgi:hypothetical protein
MNPDLLYRLNYGPIDREEFYQVLRFFAATHHDRVRALNCDGMHRLVDHHSWRNSIPFARQPVLDKVETSTGQFESRKTYLKQKDTIWLGFIDPVLSSTLLSNIYPIISLPSDSQAYVGFRYKENFRCTNINRLLELELFGTQYTGEINATYRRTALMPLGAVFYDVLRVVDQMKQNAYDVGFKGSGSLDICSGEDQYYSSREDVISGNPSVTCGNSRTAGRSTVHGKNKAAGPILPNFSRVWQIFLRESLYPNRFREPLARRQDVLNLPQWKCC